MLIEIKEMLIYGPFLNPKGEKVVSLIFNKTELQQVLFPLLHYHGIFFLTLERRDQFAKAIYLMENNLNKLCDLQYYQFLNIYLLYLLLA
jgi:hypothetical protein